MHPKKKNIQIIYIFMRCAFSVVCIGGDTFEPFASSNKLHCSWVKCSKNYTFGASCLLGKIQFKLCAGMEENREICDSDQLNQFQQRLVTLKHLKHKNQQLQLES